MKSFATLSVKNSPRPAGEVRFFATTGDVHLFVDIYGLDYAIKEDGYREADEDEKPDFFDLESMTGYKYI